MDSMQTTQGRDRPPAQWHYADERGMSYGPYQDDAIVRLFQFGHIRLETPLWRNDPAAARPLRDCTETFEIGPGSRVRSRRPAGRGACRAGAFRPALDPGGGGVAAAGRDGSRPAFRHLSQNGREYPPATASRLTAPGSA
ncbi:hypothetical protein [Luteimonas sp. R10]|uniref:hypothetical protein n=1 Tax=Luteimonas sp. R10 TaxID=3108176 RepID=UPI003091095C|nr:hypothetical protein U3649_00680 [Luteimonas sp. R10]